MSVTLKLFKKPPPESQQADAVIIPMAKPVVFETTAPPARLHERGECRDTKNNASPCKAQRYQKDRQILRDNGVTTDRCIRSSN